MRRLVLTGCVLLCLVLAAIGETNAPTTPPPARDFSEGFRLLHTLGLPEVKGAEYCALSIYGRYGSSDSLSRLGPKGNGWILPGPSGATVRAVIRSGATVTLWRQTELQKQQLAAMKTNTARRFSFRDQRAGATWKNADLAADVARLLRRLEGAKSEEAEAAAPTEVSIEVVNAAMAAGDSDALRSMLSGRSAGRRDYEVESAMPDILLFAARVHSAGLTNEANRICQKLFERAGGSRKVVTEAVERLALDLLQQALDEFQESADWKAYANAVEGLAGRFSRVWPKAPAAKLLATRLRARAEGIRLTAPLDGLPEEDRKLLQELAERGIASDPVTPGGQAIMRAMHSDGWLMTPTAPATNATPVERLAARGMEAVPLLIALLTEQAPLPPDENGQSWMYRSSYSSRSDEEVDYADPQALEAAAAELPGPMTLGRWARSVLIPVIQDEGANTYEMGRMSEPDLEEQARTWYAANRGRSPLDRARDALKSDDRSRQQEALALLVKSTNAEDRALVEQTLLGMDAENAYGALSLLQLLARQRGAAASGLVERVATNLQAQFAAQAAVPGEAKNAARMQKWFTNELAGVRALVSGRKVSFDEAVREWLTRDDAEYWGRSSTAVRESLTRLSHHDAVGALLRAAVGTNGAARARVLQLTHWVRYAGQITPEEGEEAGPDVTVPTNRAAATDFAPDWRTLLDDATPYDDNGEGFYTNVAAVAAFTYLNLFDEPFSENLQQLGAAFDTTFLGLLQQRARAMLDGKTGEELAKLPAAEDVPEVRRTALRAELLKLDAGKRHAWINGLPAAERIWIFEAAGDDVAMEKALAPGTMTIRKVRLNEAPAVAEKLGAAVLNQPISRPLLETCLAAVSNRDLRLVVITPGDMMRGASLVGTLSNKPPRELGWMGSVADSAPAMTGVVVATYVGSDWIRAFWPIGQPVEVAPTPPPAAAGADGDDEEDELTDDVREDRFGSAELKNDPALQSNFWKRVTALLALQPSGNEDIDALRPRFFSFSYHDPSQTNGTEDAEDEY